MRSASATKAGSSNKKKVQSTKRKSKSSNDKTVSAAETSQPSIASFFAVQVKDVSSAEKHSLKSEVITIDLEESIVGLSQEKRSQFFPAELGPTNEVDSIENEVRPHEQQIEWDDDADLLNILDDMVEENMDIDLDNENAETLEEPINFTSEGTEDTLSCPLCGMCLDSVEVQKREMHVNSCLDKSSSLQSHSTSKSNAISNRQSDSTLDTKQKLVNSTKVMSKITRRSSSSLNGQILDERLSESPDNTVLSSTLIDNSLISRNTGLSSVTDKRGIVQVTQHDEVEVKLESKKAKTVVQRICPFYKKIPGTSFVVDAFSYGKVKDASAYFLTHFHSDHYTRLSSSFDYGRIYCSSITANLVVEKLRVKPEFVHKLPFDQEVEINGVGVTLIDANHCPGSALFLFRVPNPPHYRSQFSYHFHTGDFRAHPSILAHPSLQIHLSQPLDTLYLDTTYIKPSYIFPSQSRIVKLCAELARRIVVGEEVVVGKRFKKNNGKTFSSDNWNGRENAGNSGNGNGGFGMLLKWLKPNSSSAVDADTKEEDDCVVKSEDNTASNVNQMCDFINPDFIFDSAKYTKDVFTSDRNSDSGVKRKVLVVVGTYLIGKERIFMEIARTLKSKVYANPTKTRILRCLENPELMSMLSSNPKECQVHVVNLMNLDSDSLMDYLDKVGGGYTHVLGFRPTGWTYRAPVTPYTPPPSDPYHPPPFDVTCLTPTYTSPRIVIFGVPYSEHSSFWELSRFVKALNVKKVIPTVNVGSEKSRNEMKKWIDQWRKEQMEYAGVKGVVEWLEDEL
ncbi:DNA repair metallo-beta-lactamase-domain-containing protein [Paraphysoderma sedebokerense]|nr:DNA repair metallo-beta-lactamase-domain-containing protein [Paraphysoderma sedebokerense]